MLRTYFVDTFRIPNMPFSGNPAAVVVLGGQAPSLATMQMIAAQLAQPETVFVQLNGSIPSARWFTPTCEVTPGGNGSVALAHVLLNELGNASDTLQFRAETFPFTSNCAREDDGTISVQFPAIMPKPITRMYALTEAFGGITPTEVREGERDVIAVFETEREIREISARFDVMARLEWLAFVATARGDYSTFAYRTFAPSAGLRECPGSASALMNLVPYWHHRSSGVSRMKVEQLSRRGGYVECRLDGDILTAYSHVRTTGRANFDFEPLLDEVARAEQSWNAWI